MQMSYERGQRGQKLFEWSAYFSSEEEDGENRNTVI